jgi:hypothetical protein
MNDLRIWAGGNEAVVIEILYTPSPRDEITLFTAFFNI